MTKWMPVNAALLGFAVVAACSASDGVSSATGGGPGAGGSGASGGSSSGGSVASGGSGGGVDLDSGSGASGGTVDPGDSGCQSYSDEAKQTYEPADIIWAVDTSGSMIEEAVAVQQNINAFSQQIVASGIDAHVVMIAAYPFLILPGICVGPPLGSGACPPQGSDTKLPNFFHHPTGVVESVDAALKLVQLFPDYKFMLRPGVPKYVVVVTDDNLANHPDSSGNAGKYDNNPNGFITDYTAIDPLMNNGAGGALWKMSAIYAFTQCSNAAHIGTAWKQIVDATGGIHGDICACPPGAQVTCTQTFQKIFDDLAKKIITGSKPLACQWTIPAPKPGETLDPNKVNVEFVDAATGAPKTIYHVTDAAACDPTIGGWYYDDNAAPTSIILCPASCNEVTAATQGSKINVVFGCATQNIPT